MGQEESSVLLAYQLLLDGVTYLVSPLQLLTSHTSWTRVTMLVVMPLRRYFIKHSRVDMEVELEESFV